MNFVNLDTKAIFLLTYPCLSTKFTMFQIMRGHTKLSKGHMRKLEKQVHERRATEVRRATELQAETLALPLDMIDEKF